MNLKELLENIDIEIQSLDRTFEDISTFPKLRADDKINNYDKSAIALMLSQFYNGLENIFKRILLYENIKINKNENYHIEIINQFNQTMLDKYRFVLSDDILNTITIMRRFRHYVFHGYSFNLEWDRLKIAVNTLTIIYPNFKNELDKLMKLLVNNEK